jgi:PLP dependent protein
MNLITENISLIHDDIIRLSPYPERVTLIAVTKRFPISVMRQAVEAGIKDLGESRMQEAIEKFEQESFGGVTRHFIGPLQSNKVQKLVDHFHWLHSLDQIKSAQKIHKKKSKIKILIQVNTTGEESKSGVGIKNVKHFVTVLQKEAPSLLIRGLMTMGPLGGDENQIRESFRALRESGESLKSLETDHFKFREYSMGMSGDYRIALEEGATFLRIGQRIFGPRPEDK